jgi:hypothetical protein
MVTILPLEVGTFVPAIDMIGASNEKPDRYVPACDSMVV